MTTLMVSIGKTLIKGLVNMKLVKHNRVIATINKDKLTRQLLIELLSYGYRII